MLLFLAWVRVPCSWHDCWNDGTHSEVFNDSYQLEVDGEEIRVILGSFTYPLSNRSVENLLETNGNGTISIGWRKLSLISQILFHYAWWWAQKSLSLSLLTNKMQNDKQLNGSLRFSRASEWLLGITLNSHWLPLKFSHTLIAHFGCGYCF